MNTATQKERLFESVGTVSFTVYADFNCPFCYSLNERLSALKLEHRVDFRMIQQRPEIHSGQIGFESLSELTAEVAEVRRRAPSTEINVPMFRPNTAAAVALVYAISRVDPLEAVRLRRRIFRALWVGGEDISMPETLAGLLLELDLEMTSPYTLSNNELTAWQSEWSNNTEFKRNLPIVIAENGETIIGFPLEPELDAFLESGSLVSDKVPDGIWQPQKRQRILVLDDHAPSLRIIVEQMHDTQVEVVDDIIGLIAHARNLGMPDLLIVNTALVGMPSGSDWWRNLTHSNPNPAIPIIHIVTQRRSATETAAMAAGAADIITRPIHPKLLRSRLNAHLHARRARQQAEKITRVDALTSLRNRREFDSRLRAEWIRSARVQDSLGLLMIDVDRLGAYNESCGHLRGDECLALLAQALGDCLQRSGDLVARYRGGLFAALLPAVDLDGALKIARDCERAVAGADIPHPACPISTRVTVSIGVAAMQPIYDKSGTLLIEQAEIALYQAKQPTSDSVCAFDEDD